MKDHSGTSFGKNPTVLAIENYIRENGLTPGDVLPSEAAICEHLSVSRSSVREAMRTLASLDVVEIRHGHGTYVGKMSMAPLVNGMVLRLTLNEKSAIENLQHVIGMRIALDRSNAQELAAYYKGRETPKLDQIVEEMKIQFERGESFEHQDFLFHQLLNDHLSNPLMQEFSMALWEIHTRVVPRLGLRDPEDISNTVQAHAHMVEALRAGDVDKLLETIDEHYQPLLSILEKNRQYVEQTEHAVESQKGTLHL
ncbi:FadR/GntR family transcriptional regulator [Corynebacterium diphtheriae]|uniref:FadR/GntR family transcriptional regulator n=1 Tax=Corynebacterium diphtheriae TaxID=1717 RepID=UPI000EACDAD2|nr:GntR family transcriptional regulator [Corynebacterium diphtheriae]RKW96457.1 FadR family transcriptional regulator [Corynebacterium diphtheriae]